MVINIPIITITNKRTIAINTIKDHFIGYYLCLLAIILDQPINQLPD